MPLSIEVRRTDELSTDDRVRLSALFEQVFSKACPEDLFLRKYAHAWRGYSYHCLARKEGAIVGAFSAIPFRYSFFGRELLFAATADLMMEKELRGSLVTQQKLSTALYQSLAADDVAFVFACLREQMVSFHRLVGRWQSVGAVSYYVAPMRGPHFPGAGALLRMLVRASTLLRAGGPDEELPIHKIDDRSFRDYRYNVFPSEYRTIKAGGGEGIYTGRLYYGLPGIPESIRLSLLLDVSPLRASVFDRIVRAIRKREPGIDYLAWQGRLPFQPKLMLRVPRFLERPHWEVCGRILRPDLIDERVYDIGNWNINLSNGDVV